MRRRRCLVVGQMWRRVNRGVQTQQSVERVMRLMKTEILLERRQVCQKIVEGRLAGTSMTERSSARVESRLTFKTPCAISTLICRADGCEEERGSSVQCAFTVAAVQARRGSDIGGSPAQNLEAPETTRFPNLPRGFLDQSRTVQALVASYHQPSPPLRPPRKPSSEQNLRSPSSNHHSHPAGSETCIVLRECCGAKMQLVGSRHWPERRGRPLLGGNSQREPTGSHARVDAPLDAISWTQFHKVCLAAGGPWPAAAWAVGLCMPYEHAMLDVDGWQSDAVEMLHLRGQAK
ncbi:hypothetical protein QBC34DRAFT_30959 [Podospora aff. communis PSN243]|uniref:Uncharacterized protein n=1 Tax=Podospora aff. communis PSN243 TaxID=3040156 RepID=A0AAV9G0P6_9PEZI|nr:hypothetical protein QBC34DRAFT_30959 [Podospora aff. communis PSN243]